MHRGFLVCFLGWVGCTQPKGRPHLWPQGIWKWWEDSEQSPSMLPKLEVREQCSWHLGSNSMLVEDD